MFDLAQKNLFFHLAHEKVERLEAAWAALDSPAAITAFQARARARFWEALGGPAEKCDLQSVVTGTIQADGYRIEKVHFQSLPGFIVTANLYVPDKLAAAAPGVLVAMGHHPPAKAWPEYQILCANLALRGAVVLGFDPLGQSERGPFYSYHYGDAKGNAHDAQGYQCQLTGRPLAFYFVWDSIRALDYLASRPEVDATRLGCTGSSGGGEQTTHLAALDERVAVAAPICYAGAHFDVFATWMLHPEGNLSDMFDEVGPCNENLAICVAPRPQVLIGGGDDQLPLTGMHRVFGLLRRIYGQLGAEDRVGFQGIVENHGCTPPMREAVYEAMRIGLGLEGPAGLPDVATRVFTPEELHVTRSGHVEELGSISVHQLNLARAEALVARRSSRPRRTTAEVLAALRNGLFTTRAEGTQPSADRGWADEFRLEAVKGSPVPVEDGARLTQYFVVAPTASEPLLTLNAYEPREPAKGVLLYVRDPSYAHFGSLIRAGLRRGHAAITTELPYADSQRLLMLGMTPAGFYDLILAKAVPDLLAAHAWSSVERRLVAQGRLSQLVGSCFAMHQPDYLRAAAFVRGYLSFVDSLRGPRQAHPELQVTMGLLQHLDFPGVLAALSATPVIIANAIDGQDNVYPPDQLAAAVGRVGSAATLRALSCPEDHLYARLGEMIFA